MIVVGICPACIDYIDAKNRFEQLCIGRGFCSGCGTRGRFDAFRILVDLEGLGDPLCSDCMSMTHCETHHKVEGLYPFMRAERCVH